MNTFNETCYNVGNKCGQCYLWNETDAARGSNEIATIIYKYISSHNDIEEIAMFSDTCGGENRNQQMVTMCMYCVEKLPKLQKIEHKFFEPGHSEMEADSMHSTIKRASKYSEIHVPFDWDNVCRSARHNPSPYLVQRLSYADFLNWKKYSTERGWTNFKKNSDGEQVSWRKIRIIKCEKAKPETFQYKYSFSDEERFKEVTTVPRKSKRIQSQFEIVPTQLYKTVTPISNAKKRDLLSMCSMGIIRTEYHDFYNKLTASDKKDKLDIADVEESDESDQE